MSYQLKYRLLMAFFMSLFMAFIMSGVIMSSRLGITAPHFLSAWRDAFFFAWPIALLSAFFVSPIVQIIINKLLAKPAEINTGAK